jgi:hypothetical protein
LQIEGGEVHEIGDLKRRTQFTTFVLLLAGILFLGILPRAHALSIRLSDGSNQVTCVDGAGCDLSSEAGAVAYIGTVGQWIFNLTAGITYPLVGTQAIPTLDLISVNVSTLNPGTLTISLSETGYTGPLNGTFQLAVGGTTTGLVSFGAFYDLNGTLFGTSNSLGDLGSFTGPAFSGAIAAPLNIDAPSYSMTLVSNITHSWWGGASSFDFEAKLPEPASIILLGSGLVILGLVGRRRKGVQGS